MNCREFEKIAAALGRREALEPGVREDALNHAGRCAGCGARLEAEQALTAALAAVAAEIRGSQAPDRVEIALRRAFREQRPAVPARAVRRRWPLWAAGAAAAAAVAAVLLVPRGQAPRTAAPPPPVARAQAPPAPAPAPVVTAVRSRPAAAVRRAPVPRPEREVPRQTGFLALPYARGAAPATEVWITRMRVSRTALAAAGLPVNMDRMDEAVVADVAFAGDGVARAVRILY